VAAGGLLSVIGVLVHMGRTRVILGPHPAFCGVVSSDKEVWRFTRVPYFAPLRKKESRQE
jgi:hypothetical protein